MKEIRQFSVLRTDDDWGREIEVYRNTTFDINGMVITITEESDDSTVRVARVMLNAEQIHALFGAWFR